MTDKRYVVPDGMLKAARDRVSSAQLIPNYHHPDDVVAVAIDAVVRWLSKNPIHPKPEQWNSLFSDWSARLKCSSTLGISPTPVEDQIRFTVMEWQRRMFLAQESEYKDGTVIWKEGTTIPLGVWSGGKMYTTNIPTLDTQADNSCPACDHGQSLERGEGTHREGTRQHPVEPEVSPSTELYRAFHRAWSSKVRTEGYNKDDWNKIDSLLNRCLYPSK